MYQHPDDDSLNQAASRALDKIVDLELTAVPAVTSVLIDSRGNKPQVNTLLGGALPREFTTGPDVSDNAFEAAFDTALMPICWRSIQPSEGDFDWSVTDRQLTWCQDRQMRTVAGPLMRLAPETLPEWVLEMENDSHRFLRKADEFVRAAAAQYGSKVNLWYAAAGMNMGAALGINEESRLRLTAACVESIREVDPQTPVMVGFDQPWGEYLGSGGHDFAPIEFADTLIRAGLGIAALSLELNFDTWPRGTTRRDVFTLLEQLNRWSQFQLPLVLIISAPSQPDLAAEGDERSVITYDASPQHQARLVREMVPLLQAHPVVQGIVWNQWYDTEAVEFGLPHTGLVDQSGQAKPSLKSWTSIRHAQHAQHTESS
ncbi:MAG: hypothetical protein AAF497_21390 [Planctomycetota bacterium]